MRCEIAVGVPAPPAAVFLDEPTIGLDVVVKQRIRELIREVNRDEGTTVFLTSHDAGDMEQLCSRAVVIHHGGILLDAPVDRLKREVLNRKVISLTLAAGYDASMLPPLPGTEAIASEGRRLKLGVDLAVTDIEAVLGAVIGTFRLDDVTVEDPPMEEIITHIYGTGG